MVTQTGVTAVQVIGITVVFVTVFLCLSMQQFVCVVFAQLVHVTVALTVSCIQDCAQTGWVTVGKQTVTKTLLFTRTGFGFEGAQGFASIRIIFTWTGDTTRSQGHFPFGVLVEASI